MSTNGDGDADMENIKALITITHVCCIYGRALVGIAGVISTTERSELCEAG